MASTKVQEEAAREQGVGGWLVACGEQQLEGDPEPVTFSNILGTFF